jgi:hypothetical protein
MARPMRLDYYGDEGIRDKMIDFSRLKMSLSQRQKRSGFARQVGDHSRPFSLF